MNQTINPPIAPVEIPPGYLNIMGYVDESEVNRHLQNIISRSFIYVGVLARAMGSLGFGR